MYRKKLEILILVGAPGSGKSTYASIFLQENKNWIRVSRDDFRAMQFEDTRATNATEVKVSYAVDACILGCLNNKLNVLIDATHCKMEYINHYIKKFNHLANIKFELLDLPLEELKERCKNREAETGKHIPIAVIENHFNKLQHLKTIFNFEPIPCKMLSLQQVIQDETKPMVFLCDLDGTIAKANGRTMFNPTADEVMTDTPILPAIKLLQSLAKEYQIIFVSGREDSTFNATKAWIEKYVFDKLEDYQLLMRKAGDNRRDSIIKKEILRENILPQYNVIGVFDDRLQVIRECWNAEGIFCFNVNQFLEEF